VQRLATLEESSATLKEALKNNFWIDPAPDSSPYALLNPHKEDGSDGQVLRLMQIFKHKVCCWTGLILLLTIFAKRDNQFRNREFLLNAEHLMGKRGQPLCSSSDALSGVGF